MPRCLRYCRVYLLDAADDASATVCLRHFDISHAYGMLLSVMLRGYR